MLARVPLGKDIMSNTFKIAHLRDVEWGAADGYVEGDADEAGYTDGAAKAKTVTAWARALRLGNPARRALLAAIADIHAAPVIILQQRGDVLIAPPGWGHWVLTLRGQTVGNRVGAVSVVAWHTNARSRGSALLQLISVSSILTCLAQHGLSYLAQQQCTHTFKTACTEIGGGSGRRTNMTFLDFWPTSSAIYGTDGGSKDVEAASASFEPPYVP
jgi:hypothetical protein